MTFATTRPRIGVDGGQMPSRYLTIDGVAADQIGYSCGTCGLVLRRQPDIPSGPLPATAVRDRLNAGLDGLDMDVIHAFAAQLPRGDYQVLLLDVLPAFVEPGAMGDYFAFDGPAGWRDEDHEDPIDPANASYYRIDSRGVGDHDQLFEFLLDGHHKTAAAVANNAPIRLLTFVSSNESLAYDDELLRLPEIFRSESHGKEVR